MVQKHKGRDGRLKTRVKTAKGRKLSSTLWLERQLNDPYVIKARNEGYRSRAVYKLQEIDDRYHFLKPGLHIVDLGSAPGGWLQAAVLRSNALKNNKSLVIGLDIQPVDTVLGAKIIELDFLDKSAPAKILDLAQGKVDIVLSDMAAPVIGHKNTDSLRTTALAEAAAYFACDTLSEGGVFCTKVFQGGTEHELLQMLKKNFTKVIHVKPKASRKESTELYVLGLGFKKKI